MSGFMCPDIHLQFVSFVVSAALEAQCTVTETCVICLEEVKCTKACCLWMCPECVVAQLKASHWVFKCTSCSRLKEGDDHVVRSASARAQITSLRDTEELLKFRNVQICECSRLLIIDHMYAKQTCPWCKRIMCFFCGEKWNDTKMQNGKDMCSPQCSYASLLQFQLVPFQNGGDIKLIPDRRPCPSCYVVGAYGEKCKWHTCTECSHEFCFLCLKDEKTCKISGYNSNCELVHLDCSFFPSLET